MDNKSNQVEPSSPAVGSLFGVQFTRAQCLAAETEPPQWDLNPPQREEYDDDHAYALGERDYADRVIAANAPDQARLHPSPEAGCSAFPTTCKCGRPLEGYETTCCKFCMNTPNAPVQHEP